MCLGERAGGVLSYDLIMWVFVVRGFGLLLFERKSQSAIARVQMPEGAAQCTTQAHDLDAWEMSMLPQVRE